MWTSVAASGFGDRLIMLVAMALMGMTAANDNSVTITAGINFWFFFPWLIISPPGGWLADKMPRKWLMFACDEIRAALLFCGFLLIPAVGAAAIPGDHHWKIFALMAAVGTFAAVFSPARNATVPEVIPPTQLTAANGILISIATIASLFGAIVGGWIINEQDSGTLRTVLIMGVLFYFFSGLLLTLLRIVRRQKTAKEKTGFFSMFAALGYMKSHKKTIGLTLVNVLVWGAAMVVSNSFTALNSSYGFDPGRRLRTYTEMFTCLGAGMLAGGLFVAWMNKKRESVPLGMLGLTLAGMSVAMIAICPWYVAGLAATFGVGFFGNMAIICTFSLLMGIAPNYIRGRVMGINSLATTVAIVLANLIIWQLPTKTADLIMVRSLWPTAAVLMIVGIWGFWALITRGPMPKQSQNIFWHLDRMFTLFWHGVTWYGKHRVPTSGPCIMAANHTAGIDPFLIQGALVRPVRWVMITKNYYRIMTPLWKAINPIAIEEGKPPIAQLKAVLESLKAGEIVGIFPEGGLQRDHRNLQKFQSGVGMIAVRSGAMIVPVWITDTPMRKKMIWHFLQPSRSKIFFGEAYKPDTTKSYEEIVEDLRQRMMALAKRSLKACPNCDFSFKKLTMSTIATCPSCGSSLWGDGEAAREAEETHGGEAG
ncbi:MAG: MFS transporter [Phycisphaeraceae bacterium]